MKTKVGGFNCPVAAAGAWSIANFFAGQRLFAISKEIVKTLILELLYARNGYVCNKDGAVFLSSTNLRRFFNKNSAFNYF